MSSPERYLLPVALELQAQFWAQTSQCLPNTDQLLGLLSVSPPTITPGLRHGDLEYQGYMASRWQLRGRPASPQMHLRRTEKVDIADQATGAAVRKDSGRWSASGKLSKAQGSYHYVIEVGGDLAERRLKVCKSKRQLIGLWGCLFSQAQSSYTFSIDYLALQCWHVAHGSRHMGLSANLSALLLGSHSS